MLDTSRFLKDLSDSTRLRATLLIRRETELCVCELVTALQLSQPKISRHLAQLRKGGVLQDSRRGQWVYYALSADLPVWAVAILSNLDEAHASDLAELQQTFSTMPNRPGCCL